VALVQNLGHAVYEMLVACRAEGARQAGREGVKEGGI